MAIIETETEIKEKKTLELDETDTKIESGNNGTSEDSFLNIIDDEELNELPEGLRNKVRGYVIASKFRGPLPPPDILAQYNNAHPEAAERIITSFEKQSAHRQYIEKKQADTNSIVSYLGPIFAFVICITCLIVSGIVINNGHPVAGTLLAGGGLAGVVTAFLRGTRHKSEKNNNHQNNS